MDVLYYQANVSLSAKGEHMFNFTFFLPALFTLLLTSSATFSSAYYTTPIEFNGVKTWVHFNDGDTFRIVSGDYKDSAVRVEGLNTLESYGPVHQWGEWTAEELFKNSVQATAESRKGNWHCVSKSKRDTYRRLLGVCDDLSVSLISKGLAHVMTIDKTSGDKKLIKLQQIAMRKGVGMWEKGVPEYILTSAHSSDEADLKGNAYNRFVSTQDGHSEIVKHHSVYKDCTRVHSPLASVDTSTLLYVPFESRYGQDRASCLQ